MPQALRNEKDQAAGKSLKKRFTLDAVDVFCLFQIMTDARILQQRLRALLGNIAGIELEGREKERHMDESYEDYVKSEFKTYFNLDIRVFDPPELKIIKPNVEAWEEKEGKA